ncbi:unannotated protein [freshwater metagenome]|uniref:Unannotated protein n=1 Tax=freshwater metagenome TaxID=449393 RepID=A0A6J6YIK3_9ZZZZ
MWLDELGHLGHGRLPVHGEIAAGQLLGHPRADHMDTQDLTCRAISILLGNDLHEAVDLPEDLGTAVCPEWVLGNHHVESGRTRLLLVRPGPRHFGMAVDGPRHPAVVDWMRVLAEQVLHGKNSLCVADVSELRSVDEVADCVHTRFPGAAVRVNLHEAAVGQLHLGALEAEKVRERPATDRHHHGVHLDVVHALDVHSRAAGGQGRVAVDLRARQDLDPLLAERLHDHVCEVGVEPREHLGQALENRDL